MDKIGLIGARGRPASFSPVKRPISSNMIPINCDKILNIQGGFCVNNTRSVIKQRRRSSRLFFFRECDIIAHWKIAFSPH